MISLILTNDRFSEVVLIIPAPDKDQSFIHAAFNDAGNTFYAWAMGNGRESLYIWRVDVKDDDLIMDDRHELETHYASVSSLITTSISSLLVFISSLNFNYMRYSIETF